MAALGLDLETIEQRPHALFADYFTDTELAAVRAAGANGDVEVARIWSAKESVLKAAGLGLRIGHAAHPGRCGTRTRFG